jgi:cardiolipin synthase
VIAQHTRRERLKTKVEEKLRPITLPNFITLVRMAIIPFFVLAISGREYRLALWTFIVAGGTDVLDGWLARRLDTRSIIGAYLDPIADKLLLTAAYIALAIPQGQSVVIPLWLAILALFRDFGIMLVAVILYVVEDVQSFPPSVLGKLTTFLHVVTVSVVLLANVMHFPRLIPTVCFYATFILVILSGFNYIYRVSRVLEARRGGEPDGEPPTRG